MAFGLTSAPSTFMHLINHVLRPYLGKFLFVYFDDISFYCKPLNLHVEHVKSILHSLRKKILHGNLEKFTF